MLKIAKNRQVLIKKDWRQSVKIIEIEKSRTIVYLTECGKVKVLKKIKTDVV